MREASLPPEFELSPAKTLPAKAAVFLNYIDDFNVLRRASDSNWLQLRQRKAQDTAGVERNEEKAYTGESNAVTIGCEIDGVQGTAGLP